MVWERSSWKKNFRTLHTVSYTHLFVPIKKLSDEISDIKDGFGKEQLDVDDYAETAIISRNFNELMLSLIHIY